MSEPIRNLTTKNFKEFVKLHTEDQDENIVNFLVELYNDESFENFLNNGATFQIAGQPAFTRRAYVYPEFFVVDKNGFFVRTGLNRKNLEVSGISKAAKGFQDSDYLLGVVGTCGNKKVAILNGDTHESSDDDASLFHPLICAEEKTQVTISFSCLSRFYGQDTQKNRIKIAKQLANGEIKLVAWQPDSYLELTSEQRRKYNEWFKKDVFQNHSKPFLGTPPLGYTLIADRWHRAATVLLYDTVNKFTILMGQDEGAYFGVELADNPKTIESAYKSLIPKKLRNNQKVQRQGEWFVVPVPAKEVPAVTKCNFEAEGSSVVSLPRESENSARHIIDSANIRISKDKIYALNPVLVHDEEHHVQLHCGKGWFTFYRNTAKRSFSVKGVD